MQITFNLQQVLSPGSSLETNTEARGILHECLARLNRVKSHNGIAKALYFIDGYCVTFDVPNAFYPFSPSLANAESLRTLLDALISFNEVFLRRMVAKGTPVPFLADQPVVYYRTQIWDAIPALYARAHGDCKSLTAAVIAQYRVLKHEEAYPVFRFADPKPDGKLLFHILVQSLSGYEDPSKLKGMGQDELRWLRY